MRIISKFKDYYDGVQGHVQGDSFIFHRATSDPEELEYPDRIYTLSKDKFSPPKYKFLVYAEQISFGKTIRKDIAITAEYSIVSLVFCGKIYRGIKFEFSVMTDQSMFGIHDKHTYFCWDIESLQKACTEYGSVLPEIDSWYRKSRSIDEYFADNGGRVSIDLLNREDAILVVRRKDRRRGVSELIRNPCLKDLQFFKVMDPFTTYQEIDMFLSGVLAPENKPMIKIEDKYKVQQHGFDTKFGFRTRPK